MKIEPDDVGDDDTHIFGKKVTNNGSIYTKDNIDHLRAVYTDNSATDPKQMRGFKLGSIGNNKLFRGTATLDVTAATKIKVTDVYNQANETNPGQPKSQSEPHEYKDLTRSAFEVLKIASNKTTPADNLDNIIKLFTNSNNNTIDLEEDKTPREILEMISAVCRSDKATNIFNISISATAVSYDRAKELEVTKTESNGNFKTGTDAPSDDEKDIINKFSRWGKFYDYVSKFIELYFETTPTTKADFDSWEKNIKLYKKTTSADTAEKDFIDFNKGGSNDGS